MNSVDIKNLTYEKYKSFENNLNISQETASDLVKYKSVLVENVKLISITDLSEISLFFQPEEISNLNTFYNYASSSEITLDFLRDMSLGKASVKVKHPLSGCEVSSRHCIQLAVGTFLRFQSEFSTFYLYQYNFTCEALFFPDKKVFIYFPKLDEVKYHLESFFHRLIDNVIFYAEYYKSKSDFGGLKFEHPSPFHYYYYKVQSFYRVLSNYPSLLIKATTTPMLGSFFDLKVLFENAISSSGFKGGSGKKNDVVIPYECLHKEFFISFGDRWEESLKEDFIQLDNFISKTLTRSCSTSSFYESSTRIKKSCDVFIWLGITSGKRSWLEESEAYIKLINYFIQEGKNVGVAFDGWTSTLKHANVSKSNELYNNDERLMEEIVKGVSNIDRFMSLSLIGATALDKICVGNMIDFFVGNHSTGSLWVSRICKKPGITHTSNATRTHALKVNHHFNSTLIPERVVSDFKTDGDTYRVSYSIDADKFLALTIDYLNKNKVYITSNFRIENDVLFGSEQYLFLWKGGQKQFEFLSGERSPSDISLINFESNIRKRIEICNSRSICFKHIVFPSKALVKTRFLPKGIGVVNSVFESHYEKSVSDLVNESLLYPLNELRAEELHHSTFYKNDTHMSDRGNVAVAHFLIKAIGLEPKNNLDGSFEMRSHKGDLCSMTNGVSIPEELYISNPQLGFVVGNRDYLSGNTNDVQIFHSFYKKLDKRVLIFGDSFFKELIPFLLSYFKEVFYIRSEFFHEDIVELYQPDYVFSGNAERYLASIRSDEVSNNFVLALYGEQDFQPSSEYKEAYMACLSYKYNYNVYQSWVKSLELSASIKLSLSDAQLSENLIRSEAGNFESTAFDPFLQFKQFPFKSCFYVIQIEIESDVESTLQVYFTDIREEKLVYTEANSKKIKINLGMNNLRVSLKSLFLGENLRIDPIEGIGAFCIKSITVTQEKNIE
jgi:hypothetical protein